MYVTRLPSLRNINQVVDELGNGKKCKGDPSKAPTISFLTQSEYKKSFHKFKADLNYNLTVLSHFKSCLIKFLKIPNNSRSTHIKIFPTSQLPRQALRQIHSH